MRSTYTLVGKNGRKWEFSPDAMDFSNFEEYGSGQIHSDGYETVATAPVEGGSSPAFGRGDSTNTEDAEAFFWLDARKETDADADGEGDELAGNYRVRVVNEAGDPVDNGLIHQGRLDRARKGDPDKDSHGDWGIAFPRQYLMQGFAEVPAGEGYQIAVELKSKNGTHKFKLGDSGFLAEGYSGQPRN